jgi:hypothetical protein
MHVYTPVKTNAKQPVVIYINEGYRYQSKKPCNLLSEKGFVTVDCSYPKLNYEKECESLLFFIVSILSVLTMLSQNIFQISFAFVLFLIFSMILILVHTENPPKAYDYSKSIRNVKDLAKKMKWVVDNISEYNGDKDKIYLVGCEGVLATLISTNNYFLNSNGLSLDSIKGVISLNGIYSDKRLDMISSKKHYSEFPIYNITTNTPPTLLIVNRDISAKKHCLDYHYALKQSGIYVETAVFNSNYKLCDKWHSGKENENVLSKILDFLTVINE